MVVDEGIEEKDSASGSVPPQGICSENPSGQKKMKETYEKDYIYEKNIAFRFDTAGFHYDKSS